MTVPPAYKQVFPQRWQDVVTRTSRLTLTSNRKAWEMLPATDRGTWSTGSQGLLCYLANLKRPFLVANTQCRHTMDHFNVPPMPGAISQTYNSTSDNPSTCTTFLQGLCQHNAHATFTRIQIPCPGLWLMKLVGQNGGHWLTKLVGH